MRTVSVAIAAVALLIVLSVAVPPAFAPVMIVGLTFGDQTGHYELIVNPATGGFDVYSFSAPLLLCHGTGAQISYGGYLSIQSSYSGFVTGAYLSCQAGIYGNIRANGMVSGIITVVLANPRSVGYPLMQGYFMSQAWAFWP